ncbi:MAG: hypothetical protein KatS3mg111_2877 [Pirellulaceae bacterium]|nr:MAG: hypothetical protein KatS3mg111_2877 [Pirellulaceae bacterium]
MCWSVNSSHATWKERRVEALECQSDPGDWDREMNRGELEAQTDRYDLDSQTRGGGRRANLHRKAMARLFTGGGRLRTASPSSLPIEAAKRSDDLPSGASPELSFHPLRVSSQPRSGVMI